jgi:hypothetical protein
LLHVEPLVPSNFRAGQLNALIETFCIHARNLHEFFQGSRADTAKANTFADEKYKPHPNDQARKILIAIKQISHLTEQRTSELKEKVSSADRAQLYSSLIAEADNFTRHSQPHLRPAWKYVPGAAAFGDK